MNSNIVSDYLNMKIYVLKVGKVGLNKCHIRFDIYSHLKNDPSNEELGAGALCFLHNVLWNSWSQVGTLCVVEI